MDGWCFPTLASGARTLALMGRTGNGKSATGNSILGKKAFTSRRSLSGVTSSAECQSATLPNGEVVNVIDTPGLFDFSVGNEIISKEIMRCIYLAKDGVDAILLVFSLGARFTDEEVAAFESLRTFFGPKITEYIIVVFTGGDNMEEEDSLTDYLDSGSDRLKEIIKMCNSRVVLFDNKTKDQVKKESQLVKLFSLVDKVMEKNGQRYSHHELFEEFREAAMKKMQQEKEVKALEGRTEHEITELLIKLQISHSEHIMKLQERVESTLKETQELNKQLDKEKAARSKAAKVARAAQAKADEDIRKLNEALAKSQSNCAIL